MIVVYPVEDADKLTDGKGRVLPDCFLVHGYNGAPVCGRRSHRLARASYSLSTPVQSVALEKLKYSRIETLYR